MYNIDTWPILHTRISSMAGMKLAPAIVLIEPFMTSYFFHFPFVYMILPVIVLSLDFIQAKMGMMEDFEASLQVLRGFDTDISVEVNEIKVLN